MGTSMLRDGIMVEDARMIGARDEGIEVGIGVVILGEDIAYRMSS